MQQRLKESDKPASTSIKPHQKRIMSDDLSLVSELIEKPHRLEDLRDDSASQLNCVDELLHEIPYSKFFASYLVPNRPCVFGPWLTQDWKCRKEWVAPSNSSVPLSSSPSIDFPLLKRMFGNVTVPVANCKSRQYDAQIKSDWKFSDYLVYLEGYHVEREVSDVY